MCVVYCQNNNKVYKREVNSIAGKEKERGAKMVHAFVRLLGNSPTARVLHLLLEGREFDYAISDIAEGSGVHRTTVSEVVESLMAEGFVIKTRRMGKSQLFKLNMSDPRIQKLLDLYQQVLEYQRSQAQTKNHTEQGADFSSAGLT
jgi:DNA-binding transcriptional ArsR family regulator